MVLAEFADPIVSIGLIIFALSLAPSVYNKSGRSIPLITSVPTTFMQALIGVTFLELRFYGTFTTSMALTAMWGVLMAQRVMARGKKE